MNNYKYNELLGDIDYFNEWEIIMPIKKGMSNDKKYYIESSNNKYLLKLSDYKLFDNKQQEFRWLKKLKEVPIRISNPVEFGVCGNGMYVYTLLEWISGFEVEDIISNMSIDMQRDLGLQAGQNLKLMHSLFVDEKLKWIDKFKMKVDDIENSYHNSRTSHESIDKSLAFILSRMELIQNRPQTFVHGDYHVRNMILSEDNKINIIDIDRYSVGDPWSDFAKIYWNVKASSVFTTSLICGYFDNNIPNDFFEIMAVYILRKHLSLTIWEFRDNSISNFQIKSLKEILDWYNGLENTVPNWFIK